MNYRIEALWKPGMQLTQTQVQSVKFTKRPRVGATIVTHEVPMVLEKSQLLVVLDRVRELVVAQAVKVVFAGEAGSYEMSLDDLTYEKLTAPPVVIDPVVESTTEVPVEPPAPLVTPDSADPVSEDKPAEVQEEQAPATPDSADVSADVAPAPKAKRGKKAKQE